MWLWGCNGNPNQKWTYTEDGTFVNLATKECLDSNADGKAYNSLCTPDNKFQKWKIHRFNPLLFQNVATNLFLTGNWQQQVFTKQVNGDKFQKWYIP